MNGATTEPCARINNPAKISITMMIGANQIFFRTRRKTQSSLRNCIDIFQFKIDF